jgi:gamma-glutamyl:cysteine ligase YbdK (ATP-grasp superfamily)
MKMGIEEEFLVLNPDTLFNTPGALRLVNALVYQDIQYFKKSNIELPLNSKMLKRPLSDLKKAFSVVEIKTSPHEDIFEIKNEIQEHRNNLVDAAKENNLMLLPTGIHPLYSSKNSVPDSCASLHIHVENLTDNLYKRLFYMIPFLISVSVNSPFYAGEMKAMSSRSLISHHIGIPKNRFARTSDIIINKSLNTVEIRTLDTQITLDDTIGIVEMIRAIAENDIFDEIQMSEEKYLKERHESCKKGRGSVQISEDKYELLLKSGDHAKNFLKISSGAEWQIQVAKEFGVPSVITSLWNSLKQNKRTIKTTSKKISEEIVWSNLIYAIPYSPFLLVDKYKKYHQDMVYQDEYKDVIEDFF